MSASAAALVLPSHRESRRDPIRSARGLVDLLHAHLGGRVKLLPNRRLGPGSDEVVDLIVVARSGVWVVDVVSGRGGRISVRHGDLLVDGRTRASSQDRSRERFVTVAAAVAEASVPGAPHHARYCLVDAVVPRRREWVDGAEVVGYRALLRSLRSSGPLTTVQQHVLHAHLARRFPPA